MSDFKITIYGANGDVLPLSGKGTKGLEVLKDGMQGYYDAVVSSEWTRARRERGGRFKGTEIAEREVDIPVRVTSERKWIELDSRLAEAIPYGLDPWDEDAKLARLSIEADRGERSLGIQRSRVSEYHKDFDPLKALTLGQGIVTLFVKAAQPLWEEQTKVTWWETAGTSGTGTIEVSNPTDQPMFQEWLLTPGKWTLPDYRWGGPARKRTVREARTIPLNTVPAGNGLRVSLDPMRRMFADLAGTNVPGQVGAGYWFMYEVPPYTQKTLLPIKVTGAPSGGARAELHQPRLWGRPWGLQ